MVMMVLWGHISPQLMQKLMAKMSDDLKLHKDGRLDVNSIDKLGGIGSKGAYPNHCWKDLQKIAASAKAAQAPYAQASYEAFFTGQIRSQCAYDVATHIVCCHL